jgi:hypothetical protein
MNSMLSARAIEPLRRKKPFFFTLSLLFAQRWVIGEQICKILARVVPRLFSFSISILNTNIYHLFRPSGPRSETV